MSDYLIVFARSARKESDRPTNPETRFFEKTGFLNLREEKNSLLSLRGGGKMRPPPLLPIAYCLLPSSRLPRGGLMTKPKSAKRCEERSNLLLPTPPSQ